MAGAGDGVVVISPALRRDLRKQDCASPSSSTWPVARLVDPFYQIRLTAGSGPDPGSDQLARLLEWAYGYCASQPGRRRAPSAGALYPCELITIEPGMTGWRCFLYDFWCQQRIWLAAADADAVARALPLGRRQGAVLVSAALWRSVQRYGARGYRYCALDAGHIIGNLSRIASRTVSPPSWYAPLPSSVCAPLALPDSVVPLAVGVFDLHCLDVPPAPAADGARSAAASPPGRSIGGPVPEEAPLVSPQLLRVRRFHERVQACATACLTTTPAAPAAPELFTVLEARRSAKDFRSAPPREFSPQALTAIAEYLGDAAPGAGQVITVTAQGDQDRPADSLSQADLCDLCQRQSLVCRAGAALLLTGPRPPGQPAGGSDHGDFLRACMYAGMLSAEFYRLAAGLGLASTMIGGFWDSAIMWACRPGQYPLALQIFGQPAVVDTRKVDAAIMVEAHA